MNKLTLAVLISAAMSTTAMAHDHMEKDDQMKKIPHTFNAIDKDKDGMLGKQEVSDHVISKRFEKVDKNSDNKISENEYLTFYQNNPKAFSEDVNDKIQVTKAKVKADADKVLANAPKDMKTDETQVGANMEMEDAYSTDSDDMNAMKKHKDNMRHSKEDMEHKTDMAMNTDNTNSGMQAYNADRDADLRNNDEMAGNEGDRMVAKNEFKMMDKNGDGMVSEEEASEAGVNSTFSDMDENEDNMISRQEYRDYRQSQEVSR
ncbi:EF-hand domain-containing protein [Salinimonas chungwhensis]|uniref:EF-hand domain-containing protein n=1 Tax=Salinimonas chungwhensis TaxID=265425 RepID=UPI00035C5B47|nr:EF-hand domain-containing protein [Salinimonas chungwhensis]